MQNLVPSETVFSDNGLLGSEGAGDSTGCCLGFLTDQTARVIETTMANAIIMNKSGFSEIKLNDKGRTG
jgi:hypothetical protein